MNFQHFLEMLEIMLEHFQKRCGIKIVTNVIVFSKKSIKFNVKISIVDFSTPKKPCSLVRYNSITMQL